MRSAYGHKETPEEVVQLPVPIPGFVDDYAFTIQVGITETKMEKIMPTLCFATSAPFCMIRSLWVSRIRSYRIFTDPDPSIIRKKNEQKP